MSRGNARQRAVLVVALLLAVSSIGVQQAAAVTSPAEPSEITPETVEMVDASAVQTSGPVLAVDDPTNNTTTKETDDASTIVVSGRAAYYYSGRYGNEEEMHGLTGAKVQLYDTDGEATLLSETSTADDGSFQFTLEARNDTDGDGEIRAEVVVFAENDAVYVTDGDDRYFYSVTAGPLSGGNSVTVGTDVDGDGTKEILPPGDHAPYQAADWAVTPYEFTAKHGVNKTKLPVVYPAEDGTYYRYRSTGSEQIDLSDRTDRKWYESTVVHEYGHAVHFQLIGYDFLNMGSYECHEAPSETDPTFALVEGFAGYYSATVLPDSHAARMWGRHIEDAKFYNVSYTRPCPEGDADGDYDGLSVEGAVASILWDITDGGPDDDDALDYSFEAIVDVLEHNPKDMNEFYELWDRGYKAELAEIYTTYGIDKQPPTIDATNRSAPYTESAVVLDGSVRDEEEAIERLELAVDDGSYTTIATSDGNWSETRTLADGNHTVSLRATDVNGNTKEVSRTVRVSSTPPVVETDGERISATNARSEPVSVEFDYVMRYPDEASVRITNGSSVVATASTSDLDAAPGGRTDSLQVRLPETIDGGSYDVEVVVTDASNRTNTARVDDAVRINSTEPDTAEPDLTVDAPRFTADSEVTITGHVSDENLSTLIIHTPGGTEHVQNKSGNWTATVALENGSNTLVVVATDDAGNTVRRERTVGIDRQPPELTILEPTADGDLTAGTHRLEATFSDGDGHVIPNGIEVTVDGEPRAVSKATILNESRLRMPLSLDAGVHTVSVRVVDHVGNERVVSREVTVVEPKPSTGESSGGGDGNGSDSDDAGDDEDTGGSGNGGGSGAGSGSGNGGGSGGGASARDVDTAVTVLDDSTTVSISGVGVGAEFDATLEGTQGSGVTVESLGFTFRFDSQDFRVEVGHPRASIDGVPAVDAGTTLGVVDLEAVRLETDALRSASITVSVSEAALPDGAGPDDVVVYQFVGSQWRSLETDSADGGYTVQIEQFSPIAVVAEQPATETRTATPTEPTVTRERTPTESGVTQRPTPTDGSTGTATATSTVTEQQAPGFGAVVALLAVVLVVVRSWK